MRPTVPATAFRALAAACLLAVVGLGSVGPGSIVAQSSVASSRPAGIGSIRITSTAVFARAHPAIASKAAFVVAPKTFVRVYRIATDSAHRPWYLVHVHSRPGWIAGWLTVPAPVRTAAVWHGAMASSFGIGDGLVGARMACGAELTMTVLAVANRTLPCGARVRIRVGSKIVVARVMDRGPFVTGRTFDLAPAVCRLLGACNGVFRVEWQLAR